MLHKAHGEKSIPNGSLEKYEKKSQKPVGHCRESFSPHLFSSFSLLLLLLLLLKNRRHILGGQ
jgi:hypothetical protein